MSDKRMYKRCPNCGEVKGNYFIFPDILKKCVKCGDYNIESERPIADPTFYDGCVIESINEDISTFSLYWEEEKISIPIPDNGEEVYIGREFQDCWSKNKEKGLNVSRKHLKVKYTKITTREFVSVFDLGSTNGTKVKGEVILDRDDEIGGEFLQENDSILLDIYGSNPVKLIVKRNK